MSNTNGIIGFSAPSMGAKRNPEQFAKWMARLTLDRCRARYAHERGTPAPSHATKEQVIEAVCYGKTL